MPYHFETDKPFEIGPPQSTVTKKSLATLDNEIVDPEITVKLEMRDLFKVHNAQT